MNIFLNEYFGFCFELNFELNHFWAKFNEKMNFQNVSNRARQKWFIYKIVLPINATSLFIDENVAHLKRRTGGPLWLQDSLSTVVRL